ncbi:16828_t:CDS:2 [Cetraspora pellucida]|uniref:16828_t:CDS:1 n=1 Tax=Cetraspora pellucida TaxID=1433469 RepID=A0ACA9QA18_9GLOM|nr:16828_t:CDS:2 [Cetraspora pellucida]
MSKKLEIVINPLKDFHNCNGCRNYGAVEANTPQTIALMVTKISDKGIKFPPLYYCCNCADSDFITYIRGEIAATDSLGYKTEEPTYCLVCVYENRIKQQVEVSTLEQRKAKYKKEEQENKAQADLKRVREITDTNQQYQEVEKAVAAAESD